MTKFKMIIVLSFFGLLSFSTQANVIQCMTSAGAELVAKIVEVALRPASVNVKSIRTLGKKLNALGDGDPAVANQKLIALHKSIDSGGRWNRLSTHLVLSPEIVEVLKALDESIPLREIEEYDVDDRTNLPRAWAKLKKKGYSVQFLFYVYQALAENKMASSAQTRLTDFFVPGKSFSLFDFNGVLHTFTAGSTSRLDKVSLPFSQLSDLGEPFHQDSIEGFTKASSLLKSGNIGFLQGSDVIFVVNNKISLRGQITKFYYQVNTERNSEGLLAVDFRLSDGTTTTIFVNEPQRDGIELYYTPASRDLANRIAGYEEKSSLFTGLNAMTYYEFRNFSFESYDLFFIKNPGVAEGYSVIHGRVFGDKYPFYNYGHVLILTEGGKGVTKVHYTDIVWMAKTRHPF